MSKKVRRTITLDQDLAEFFDTDKEAFSATINSILREEMERRDRRQALSDAVDYLIELHGPPDPEGIQYFRDLARSLRDGTYRHDAPADVDRQEAA